MANELLTDDAPEPQGVAVEPQLPILRFRLRQLLVFIALLSLLLAGMVTWEGLPALAMLLATLVVGLHLLSTTIGSQLRAHADRVQARDNPDRKPPNPNPAANAARHVAPQLPPRSPWHQHRSTPLPWLIRLVVVAATCGGFIGAIVLHSTLGHRTSMGGIAVGSISLAVVAGWIAFVGYGFCGVFRHGIRDALASERSDQLP